MKRKISYFLCITLTLAMFLIGCNNEKTSLSSNESVKILLSFTKENGNTFRDTLAQGALSYAESVGAKLDIEDPQGSIENQVNQFKSAKENGYSAIICIPENVDTARQLIAAAEDLPIIFVNKSPEESILSQDKYIYVGSNEEVAGQYQAEYILEKLSNKNEINIVLLKGEKGHSATIGRTNKFIETLNNSNKEINIVFNDFADFATDVAKEKFNVFLSSNQEFDVVAGNNDAIALGVIESCIENNIDHTKFEILGVDATNEGCESIVNGDMDFTVYQSALGQGEYTVRAAYELATSGSIKNVEYVSEDKKHIWIPFEKVNSNNVKDYISTK